MTPGKENARTARKRVLIADCHDEVLITLEKMLEDAGLDTATAWTAQEACTLLESQIFDLVLVNEYLPDAECEELLNRLREKRRELPCIVMQPSAPGITDSAHLQALGVREIVYKYAYEHIVEVVQDCLRCEKKVPVTA